MILVPGRVASALLCVVALALAFLRVAGHRSSFFQAVAHLFVGGLFGAWMHDRTAKPYLYLALGLTAVEVACFLLLPR